MKDVKGTCGGRLLGCAAAILVLCTSCEGYVFRHWDRLLEARREVEAQDCIAVLQELLDASGGNLPAVSRMTAMSPNVILRLLDGRSTPTRTAEVAIQTVAEDFYFYKKRFWQLSLTRDWKWRSPRYWFMNLPYIADPFLNYPHDRLERLTDIELEPGEDPSEKYTNYDWLKPETSRGRHLGSERNSRKCLLNRTSP